MGGYPVKDNFIDAKLNKHKAKGIDTHVRVNQPHSAPEFDANHVQESDFRSKRFIR